LVGSGSFIFSEMVTDRSIIFTSLMFNFYCLISNKFQNQALFILSCDDFTIEVRILTSSSQSDLISE